MYGHRARIGYTSPPAVTETFAYEFYKMVPEGVTLALSTLNIVQMTKDELQDAVRISLDCARLMAEAKVDVIVLGGVPINIALGLDSLESSMKSLEDDYGIPVTCSLMAQTNALKALGAQRLGVGTPFGQDHNIYDSYLPQFGFEIAAQQGAGRTVMNLAIADDDVSIDLARRLVDQNADIDTLYYPAPHWGIIETIEPLEREFGLNVMTSVQAIVWEGLRKAGVTDAIPGYGRLLREF